MPQYEFDQSGSVGATTFRDLDLFTRAYIEAAFWTSEEQLAESDPQARQEFEFGFDTLAPETLAQIVADCTGFQEQCAPWWLDYDGTDEQAGHDFWLTRNRHGAGFWDRAAGMYRDNGAGLTEAALARGEVCLYVGDDGKVYQS